MLWLSAMKQAGYSIEHWPLIYIQAASSSEGLKLAQAQWSQWRAVFFVSPQAVMYFFKQVHTNFELGQTRCWATGVGTRDALLRQGVRADLIDTPNLSAGIWDSEHLWQEVQTQVQPNDRVLIVRGGEIQSRPSGSPLAGGSLTNPQAVPLNDTGVGREYMAEQLRLQGVQVSWAVAYLRGIPRWTSTQMDEAQQALGDGSVWIMTSSQAVKNLEDLMSPSKGPWPLGRAIATHDRIARALVRAGFGVVRESRPNIESLLGSLESMQ